jgi:hypothetical protein
LQATVNAIWLEVCGVARLLRTHVPVVDCWIGIAQEDQRRIVRLAGRLGEAQVPELLEACADSAALQLDLTDLVSADAAGFEALHRVRARGAVFVGVPGYIQLKLDSRVQGSPR